jgi:hypothetical protein
METKPREYRNNNASETIDVSKVSAPIRGFYARIEDRVVFVDTTETAKNSISLLIEDKPESDRSHRHTKLSIMYSDGSVGKIGYMMSLEGKGKPFGDPGMKWVFYPLNSQPNVSSQVQAPSLQAMMKYLQSKYSFTSCKTNRQ